MDAGEKKYHHEFAAGVEFVTDVLTSRTNVRFASLNGSQFIDATSVQDTPHSIALRSH